MSTKARRAGEGWSQSEDNQLMAEVALHMPLSEIANIHGRTSGAIVCRVERFLTNVQVSQAGSYWHLKYQAALEQLQAFNVRNSELMAQNDELSDRIHLDLDPRIKRLQEQMDLMCSAKARLAVENDELNEKLDRIHEECIR